MTYSQSQFKADLQQLGGLIDAYNKQGGAKRAKKSHKRSQRGGAHPQRTFTVHKVDGSLYKGADIRVVLNKNPKRKTAQKPGDAAHRIFVSLCKNLKKPKNNCKITFTIRESTQGGKKKEYGPYIGVTKKLSPKEIKEKEALKKKGKLMFVPQRSVHVELASKAKKGGARKKKGAKKGGFTFYN